MKLVSIYTKLCTVELPYHGRQFYMHQFDLGNPVMPPGFEDYLEAVKALCTAAGATEGIAYMTVDEKVVKKGKTQRRPGPHVDGCFTPVVCRWGHGSGGWLHTCNDVGEVLGRMPVIVAASAPGCRAWRGEFDGEPSDCGDLAHISDQLGDGEVLPANVGYLLSPDCVHESMPMDVDTQRTFLRIALPVPAKESKR
jgi:hypothetical protein